MARSLPAVPYCILIPSVSLSFLSRLARSSLDRLRSHQAHCRFRPFTSSYLRSAPRPSPGLLRMSQRQCNDNGTSFYKLYRYAQTPSVAPTGERKPTSLRPDAACWMFLAFSYSLARTPAYPCGGGCPLAGLKLVTNHTPWPAELNTRATAGIVPSRCCTPPSERRTGSGLRLQIAGSASTPPSFAAPRCSPGPRRVLARTRRAA